MFYPLILGVAPGLIKRETGIEVNRQALNIAHARRLNWVGCILRSLLVHDAACITDGLSQGRSVLVGGELSIMG